MTRREQFRIAHVLMSVGAIGIGLKVSTVIGFVVLLIGASLLIGMAAATTK